MYEFNKINKDKNDYLINNSQLFNMDMLCLL